MQPNYQLTPHPVGSKREFWAISWPLMLGLISATLMMFVDRLFLAWHDPMELNAAANGGLAYYVFLVLPISIATIGEVLVGRLHGEGRLTEVGSATWQMVWFSLLMVPLFWAIGIFLPDLLFSGTGNERNETAYFEILMIFAPLQCLTIALSGFFIGVGHVRIVTLSALVGNVVNVVLDYLLIFGLGPIPEMGIEGAAFATGVALFVQVLFLFILFLKKSNRLKYFTHKFSFHPSYFFEGIRIGAPSGTGHFIEVLAHFIFFRIVLMVGQDQLTIVAMVQSLYILFSFVTDASSKGASAIVSNLLGANVRGPIEKVLKSAATLQFFYFLPIFMAVIFYPEGFFKLFASEEHQNMLSDPILANIFSRALIALCFFFLFDGLSWILVGFLTASGDTRYVFRVSFIVNWFAYILPTLFLVGFAKGGADVAWTIVASVSALSMSCYYVRYRSGAWLKRYTPIRE